MAFANGSTTHWPGSYNIRVWTQSAARHTRGSNQFFLPSSSIPTPFNAILEDPLSFRGSFSGCASCHKMGEWGTESPKAHTEYAVRSFWSTVSGIPSTHGELVDKCLLNVLDTFGAQCNLGPARMFPLYGLCHGLSAKSQ